MEIRTPRIHPDTALGIRDWLFQIPSFLVMWAGPALPFADTSFDVVWYMDVLEHRTDLPAAIAQIARVLKPRGLFVYDTINRSWLSRLLVIGFWEYLTRVAPQGTHDWQLFIKPHGLQPGAIQGMLPVWWSPWQGWRFRLIRYTGILSLGYALKPAAQAPRGAA